jgi:SAM-dependent methyltransferase
MKKKRIVDMGAGANPYIYATDAVDGWDKTNINAERDRFFEAQYAGRVKYCKKHNTCKNPITTRPKLKNKIKFLYNIDYTKDRLPYNDNSIDIIVSNHSLQAFGDSHALQEIYRILKPGGHIDIGVTYIENENPIRYLKKIIRLLPKYGFKNIKIFEKVKNNTLYSYQFDKDYLNVVRAYK